MYLLIPQPLPRIPKLFIPSVSCPQCGHANDEQFLFCQNCGYQRKREVSSPNLLKKLKFPVDEESIQSRMSDLVKVKNNTRYARQKSALEVQLSEFLAVCSPPKDLQSAIPRDIIAFLVWKDQGGRTVVHNPTCPNLGKTKLGTCGCPKRLAFGTVDSLIGKLRAVFSSIGRGGEWISLLGIGNPAADTSVKQYLNSIREEQLKVHTTPQQADPVFVSDIEVLSQYLQHLLEGNTLDPSEVYIVARDQAMFKALFFSADRAADLLGIHTTTVLRFPDDSGLLFNQVWTKSLRSGDSNVFALRRGNNSLICPVHGLEVYFRICNALKVDISSGYLFRTVSKEGSVTARALEATAAQARLKLYVKQLKGSLSSDRITLHGFRSGAAISMALTDVPLDQIMDHVGWKNSKTALYYIKLKQVLNPAGAAGRLANLDRRTGIEYRHMNQLKDFSKAFGL